jgi:hypothetical protein
LPYFARIALVNLRLKLYFMKYFSLIAVVVLLACGENVKPPETFHAEVENYAKWVDDKVGSVLAWRYNPDFVKGDNKMDAWVGYVEGKPLLVRLWAKGGEGDKWWIYADTATGKVIYFKEETVLEGRGVRNRFSYRGDSVAIAFASNDPYKSPYGENDFRLKPVEIDNLVKEAIAVVEKDIDKLPEGANAARKENAQFYATGGKNSWSLVINPSISSVVLRQPGAEDRKFGYDVPITGPKNESIYNFNSLKGKIEVSIFGKACGVADGRSYPYTVVIVDGTKSFAGCGVLLQ